MKKTKQLIERVGKKTLAAMQAGDFDKAKTLAKKIREADPSGIVLSEMIQEREEKQVVKTKKKLTDGGHPSIKERFRQIRAKRVGKLR